MKSKIKQLVDAFGLILDIIRWVIFDKKNTHYIKKNEENIKKNVENVN